MPYVEHTSWSQRVVNSWGGAAIGVLLFCGSFAILGWNEGRAVKTYHDLVQGEKNTIDAPCTPLNPANEGKLIHLTCNVTDIGTITDSFFPDVSAQTLFFYRRVEMFQHHEVSRTEDDGSGGKTTIYSCPTMRWNSYASNENANKAAECVNPPWDTNLPSETPRKPYPSSSFGAFTLNNIILDPLSSRNANPKAFPVATPQTNWYPDGTGVLTSVAPGNFPQVGNYRVSFQKDDVDVVSLVATQKGNTFEKHTGSSGTSYVLVGRGAKSSHTLYKEAQDENETLTWVLRFVGFFLMWLSLFLVLSAWTIFMDVLPCCGACLGDALRSLVCCLTLPIALTLSCWTIAIAWLIYRPLIGGPLFAAGCVAAGVGYYFFRKHRKSGKANISGDNETAPLMQGSSSTASTVPVVAQPVSSGYPQQQQQQPYPPANNPYASQQAYPPSTAPGYPEQQPAQGYPAQEPAQGYPPQQQGYPQQQQPSQPGYPQYQ
eukprot:m.331577 g.331577  ORF g.331577 m.331577 type:complete len:487 (+) comp19772_c1_seq6:107-1567(+)